MAFHLNLKKKIFSHKSCFVSEMVSVLKSLEIGKFRLQVFSSFCFGEPVFQSSQLSNPMVSIHPLIPDSEKKYTDESSTILHGHGVGIDFNGRGGTSSNFQ